jgi:hypothetical protein
MKVIVITAAVVNSRFMSGLFQRSADVHESHRVHYKLKLQAKESWLDQQYFRHREENPLSALSDTSDEDDCQFVSAAIVYYFFFAAKVYAEEY